MVDSALHHSVVRAAESAPDRAVLVLHGILGSGANLRGVAQTIVRANPRYAAVLVDLRMHGRSQGFTPPHSVQSCAQDLVKLEQTLAWPVHAAVGHSFGGKVALAYHALRPRLEHVVTLDSAPGPRHERQGSEQTMAVLSMLERLPESFARREDFIAQVHAEGHSRMIADWLAMNLERSDGGFRLRLELPAIRALIDDYFALDLWPVIERSEARLDLVIGGKSRVWEDADRARLLALADQRPAHVRMHVLEQAGHWVHVDDADGLAHLLSESFQP